jgi:hypothetical protein
MTARQLSRLLYAAEEAAADSKDPMLFAKQLGLPLEPRFLDFLSFLTDPAKDRKGMTVAYMIVAGDVGLGPFWRALAAHHRALACRPPEDPDGYFPMAMAVIGSIWTEPPEPTEGLSDEDKTAAKARNEARKHRVTPEGSYMYHSRMRDRDRLGLMTASLDMLVLGARTAIEEGWFEAPEWTLEVCNRLVAEGRHDEVKTLVNVLTARRHPDQEHCYFSRLAQAKLLQTHGVLQAA